MNDEFSAICWFVLNATLFCTFWKCGQGLLPSRRWWQLLAPTLIMHWSFVVVSTALAGAFAIIGMRTLSIFCLIGISVGSLVSRRKAAPTTLLHNPTRREILSDSTVWGVVALISITVFQICRHQFPGDWDTLMYHLPLVDEWTQTGTLYAAGCPVWYNAGNVELLGLWLAIPFDGDFWVRLGGVVPIVLLFLGAISVCEELHIPRMTAIAVGSVLLATPLLQQQLGSLKNDFAVAATFLNALGFGLHWCRHKSRGSFFLASLSVGLLAGVKYYALGYACVAVFSIGLNSWYRLGRKSAIHWTLTVTLIAMVVSGHWYLRNYLITGSPLFPLEFGAGKSHIEELRPGTFSSTILGAANSRFLFEFFEHVVTKGGMIQSIAVLFLPLILLLPAIKSQKADKHFSTSTSISLILAVLGSIAVLCVTPFIISPNDITALASTTRTVRFSLVPLSLITICFADLLTSLVGMAWNNKTRFIFSLPGYVLAIACCTQLALAVSKWPLIDHLTTWLLVGDLTIAVIYLCRSRNALGRATVWWVMAILFGIQTHFVSLNWYGNFASHFDQKFGTTFFSDVREDSPNGARLCTIYYRNYPFYGARRQNAVYRPEQVRTADQAKQILPSDYDYLLVLHRDINPFGKYINQDDWIGEIETNFNMDQEDRLFSVFIPNHK